MQTLDRERAVAIDLAREAGRIILGIYATDFAVTEKADDEGPVTLADKQASERIMAGLRKAFPDDGIVSEEAEKPRRIGDYERCWFIDPLDGTKEFVARNGEFAVHIGLAIGGEARLGIVYRPVGDRLYSGVIGHGAEVVLPGERRALQVSRVADPKRLRLLTSRSHRTPLADAVAKRLGAPEPTPCGSVGIKCGLIAEGVADLYLLTSLGSHLWDSCAPEAVLRAAGGVCTDLHGQAFRYDIDDTRNLRGLMACNADAAPVVLDSIRAVLA